MAKPFFQVSGDAQRALEQFSTQFYGALAAAEVESVWAMDLGMGLNSRAIKTTFPVPISSAKYLERKGDDKLRSLYERAVSVTPIQWADGVAEDALIIEAPDFIGWNQEPANIAKEGRRHPNTLVAQLLHTNPNLGFYKDQRLGTDLAIPLFSASHPINIFDSGVVDVASSATFTNLLASTSIDQALFSEAFLAFGTRVGANGQTMRLNPTDLLVPPALAQKARDFLQSDLMRLAILEGGVGSTKNTQQTSNNRWKGAVNLVIGYELVDTDKVYFIDRNAAAKPWIVQDGGEPEQILYTKNDMLYKDTNKVGIKFVLTMSATGMLPHAIMRATIS